MLSETKVGTALSAALTQTGTYIDEVLLVSLAEVVQESSLTGVGVQKHKVLHPNSVPGYQSPLHDDVSVIFHLFFLNTRVAWYRLRRESKPPHTSGPDQPSTGNANVLLTSSPRCFTSVSTHGFLYNQEF